MSERRTVWVRLSLCLLMGVAYLLLATQAQAEQPEQIVLTETNPLSSEAQPAAATEPFVIGRGDGAIATVVNPFGGGGRSPIAADVNPDNLVDLYGNENCTEAPVASGTIDELEGDGIQVQVEPNSVTRFSAIQTDPTDPGNPSICSKPLTYWSGSGGGKPPVEEEPPAGGEQPASKPPASNPPANSGPAANAPLAPRLKTLPAGPANDNKPRIAGSAPGANAVAIFANSSCSGSPLAKVSPVQLAAGVEVRVPDNSTTDFTGIALAGGKESFCSPPATYIEDSSPPRTRITMGPGAKTRHRKVVFRFADIGGDPLGASFRCKLDRRRWKPCRSPFKLKHLSYRRHTLRVIGSDPIGNVEPKAAKRRFKVIR